MSAKPDFMDQLQRVRRHADDASRAAFRAGMAALVLLFIIGFIISLI